MNVREAEEAGRRIVREKTLRKVRPEKEDLEAQKLQQQLSDVLGTRVFVERRGVGKKISIEFFSDEELHGFLSKIGAMNQDTTQSEPETRLASVPTSASDRVGIEEAPTFAEGEDGVPTPKGVGKEPVEENVEEGNEEDDEPETNWLKDFSI